MAYYISLDGDDIGNKIAKCYLENDEAKLTRTIHELNSILTQIRDYLNFRGFEIIFFAADGIACKGLDLDLLAFSQHLQKVGKPMYSFSVGIGDDLQSSFIALKYAKSIGKNTIVVSENDKTFRVIGVPT